MSCGKPLIGVTPWYDYENQMTYIKRGYMEGIIEAGGLPMLLPVTVDDDILGELAGRCRGFLLSGGPDVDASIYKEYNMPFNENISPYRDHMEIFIVRNAIEKGKPVFGICRGVQVMNAALGGTLYQDIKSQVRDRDVLKHSQEAPKWYPTHDICIEPDSRVSRAFGSEYARVNSYHHQAVKDIAPGFKVTSRAPDGIIESIEYTDHPFAVGVQWHPELMWQEDRTHLKLFQQLVRAAAG